MPRGPKGARRPADVIGAAVKVMKIATGEELEHYGPEDTKDQAAKALGKKGGTVRAAKMSRDTTDRLAVAGLAKLDETGERETP